MCTTSVNLRISGIVQESIVRQISKAHERGQGSSNPDERRATIGVMDVSAALRTANGFPVAIC